LYCGVGLKDGRIEDQDISASSTYDNRYSPQNARLDKQQTGSQFGGWLACSSCRKLKNWKS